MSDWPESSRRRLTIHSVRVPSQPQLSNKCSKKSKRILTAKAIIVDSHFFSTTKHENLKNFEIDGSNLVSSLFDENTAFYFELSPANGRSDDDSSQ